MEMLLERKNWKIDKDFNNRRILIQILHVLYNKKYYFKIREKKEKIKITIQEVDQQIRISIKNITEIIHLQLKRQKKIIIKPKIIKKNTIIFRDESGSSNCQNRHFPSKSVIGFPPFFRYQIFRPT